MDSTSRFTRHLSPPSRARSCLLILGFLATGCGSKKPDLVPTGPVETTVALSPGQILFEDLSATCGVQSTYDNGEAVRPPNLTILESLGGGLAQVDFDKDGLLDLYFPGGGYFAGPDNHTILGRTGKLYRNLGGCKFQDVTAGAGLATLAGGAPWFYTHAAAVADYDCDGWPDLLVTGWRRVALFHNEPDGMGGRRFVDVSAQAGMDQGVIWATSAAWADLDGDGLPDLYVCQYVDWSFANNPSCDYDGKTPDVCPPKKFSGLRHLVYHNRGGGKFAEVGTEAGLPPGGDQGKGLGVVAVDANGDGKPDIYVGNDTVDNYLFINQSTPGKIRLKEVGVIAGVARDGNGSANGSMGVDAGDLDGSGLPSIWVTNYENELHALYRNLSKNGASSFIFQTPGAGIAAIGQKFVGWGTGFVDLDHHGYEDLVVVNGHAIRHPTTTGRKQRPVLLRNTAGKFKAISNLGGPYFAEDHLSRGMAIGDLDNDGAMDMVVANMNEPAGVLHNIGCGHDSNHWAGFTLAKPGNKDVVGARLEVVAAGKSRYRFAKGGGSYASSPDRRLVVGLGTTASIEAVKVRWPDGKEESFTGTLADKYWRLTQGEGQAVAVGGR